MAKIKTKDGDVFVARGYRTTKDAAAFVELETDCPVAIAQLTPREALCVSDEGASEPLRFRAVKSNKTKTETGSKPR